MVKIAIMKMKKWKVLLRRPHLFNQLRNMLTKIVVNGKNLPKKMKIEKISL